MSIKIFIYGSCASRDAMDLDDENAFELVDYFARSSVASAFQDRPVEDLWSSVVPSRWQQRQIARDFSKSLKHELITKDYDVLLVDFIDERFHLYEFNDGSVVTLSAELRKTGLTTAPIGRVIDCSSEHRLSLWEKGWQSLVATLTQYNKLGALRINKLYWAETGDQKIDSGIDEGNRNLESMYGICSRTVLPEQFIKYSPELFSTDKSHRWGLSPFHYTPSLYRHTLQELMRQHSK